MDKNERASRRARNSIIQLLVTLEQPTSDEEAIASIRQWEDTPFYDLLKTANYVLARCPYANTSMVWYANLCIQEVAGSKKLEVIRA